MKHNDILQLLPIDGYYVTLDAIYEVTYTGCNQPYIMAVVNEILWKNNFRHSPLGSKPGDGMVVHIDNLIITLDEAIQQLQKRYDDYASYLRKQAQKYVEEAARLEAFDAKKVLGPKESYVSPFTGEEK